MEATLGFDRVQVVPFPHANPAKCVVCGYVGGDEVPRSFIDIGLDIEFYGVIFFCTDCFTHIAVKLGYATSESASAFMETIEKYQAAIKKVKIERDNAVAALDAVLIARPDLERDSSPISFPKSEKKGPLNF